MGSIVIRGICRAMHNERKHGPWKEILYRISVCEACPDCVDGQCQNVYPIQSCGCKGTWVDKVLLGRCKRSRRGNEQNMGDNGAVPDETEHPANAVFSG